MGGLAAQVSLTCEAKVTSISVPVSGDLIHAMYTAMFAGIQGS